MTPSLRAVSVVGPSDAGKTTLVERLSADSRVATVKSIHHDIEPDEPGTDTHRHRTAGADAAVGVTPSFAFEVAPIGGSTADSDSDADAAKRAALYDALARFAARGFDYVLVEGFADAPLPTIRVGASGERRVSGRVVATDDESFDRILSAVRGVDPAGAEFDEDDVAGQDRTADDQTTSDRRVSDRTTSDRTTSDRTTSDRTTRDRRGAVDAAPQPR